MNERAEPAKYPLTVQAILDALQHPAVSPSAQVLLNGAPAAYMELTHGAYYVNILSSQSTLDAEPDREI